MPKTYYTTGLLHTEIIGSNGLKIYKYIFIYKYTIIIYYKIQMNL